MIYNTINEIKPTYTFVLVLLQLPFVENTLLFADLGYDLEAWIVLNVLQTDDEINI